MQCSHRTEQCSHLFKNYSVIVLIYYSCFMGVGFFILVIITSFILTSSVVKCYMGVFLYDV